METCQTYGGMGTVSRGGWWGDKREGRGEAHFLEGSPHCPPVPPGLCTPNSRPRETAAGLGPGLGQGWVAGTEHGHVFVHTRPWQAV